MAKYRKKPVVIEAEQYVCGHYEPEDIFWGPNADYGLCDCADLNFIGHVHTLEGPLRVSDGDWIITGVKGEKYPCKDDIFRMTYEPVDGG